MISAVLNGLNKDLRNLIAFDIVVFILLITFVNAYKTYFLILTCALVTYLSYRLVSYFIEISTTATPPSRSANQEDDFYEFKLANLLFRNATLIRTIKMLSRNRFVRFSVYNIPIEKARAESNAAANGGAAAPAAATTSTKKEGKYDERGLPESISRFTQKVSLAYIERWYFPFVSKNDQFLKEISVHVETLLNDLFSRFLRMDKQQIFADGIYVANNNFFNMAFYNYLNGGNAQIPLEILHPAVRNSPASEMAYLKRVVLLGFRKSLPHISINEPVLEELFCQIFGKNVLQLVVDILSKPNFLWWCIGAICDRDKAVDLFAPPDYKPDDPGINPPWAQPLPGAVALQQRQELIEKLQKQQQQKAFNLSHHNHSAYSVSSPSQQQQQRRKSLSSASTGNMSLRNPVYDLENQQPLEYLYFQINNIKIVDTEISVELKSGKEFTLYNIQFEYRLRDMYNTAPELNSDCQIKKLRRRYKEFVSLQKSLEENPQFKHFLKNIKTPAKYLVLPIGNMESEYVEKRRKRLNDYLNNLVKIPEICQSRELISFLDLDSNDAFVRSNNIFDKVTGVLEKISPVGHFNRKAEELDLAIEFGKLTATSYEYTNHDTYEKFYYRLSSILEKAKAKNENNAEKKSGEESDKNKKPHLPQTNTHFSKICFEIWNKAIASASFAKGGDGHRWINNQNVYKLIEVAICDYYVEDFFAEMFNGILSPDFMVIYLQLLEYLLFEKRQRPPINFDDPNLDFHGFALNEIFNIVPKICQMAIHEELFKSSITILIGSLGSPLLNKHIFYSILDLIMLNLYGEDFNKCDQQQQPQTSTNNNQ